MSRNDIYKVTVQDNLYFLVFHKNLPVGFGSAVSLYINNFEFLKFDCFGENKGHYHIYDNKLNETIYFTEKTPQEQINRTCELISNINLFLIKSNKNYIKNFKIDMNIFLNKIDLIKNKLLEFELNFYSLLR
jgi:hypothetical protein